MCSQRLPATKFAGPFSPNWGRDHFGFFSKAGEDSQKDGEVRQRLAGSLKEPFVKEKEDG
jgi:hypothetical protein